MKNTAQSINLQTIIPDHFAGKRLDQSLAELFPEYSRSCLQTWIRNNHVKVDGQSKRPRDHVLGGEKIEIEAPVVLQTDWQPQKIHLDIVYEDESLFIINKPIGLVVHPAVGNPDKTLVNALLYHHPELANLPRAGVVHRLDKDTSGLLVVAKTLTAHTALVKQLQARSIEREYAAIVTGILISGGVVDEPMARDPIHRKKMAVIETGKSAVTHYRVIERFRAHTYIKVQLETGRTHQIRVHMAYIRHPIAGDGVYGGRLQLPKGASEALIAALRHFKHQALHAQRLGFIHPETNEYVEWQIPLPQDMQDLLKVLKQDNQ